MLLAYDTTDRNTTISWQDSTANRHTKVWERAKATEILLPAMTEILQSQRLKMLGLVRGPGSFTGIRVGLATAAGLCAAQQVQAFGFTRQELAAPHVGDGTLILGVGRGGALRVTIQEGKAVDDVAVAPLESLEGLKDLVSLAPLKELETRVVSLKLTELILERLQRGPNPEAHPLEPCYVRPADAVAGKPLIARLLAERATEG